MTDTPASLGYRMPAEWEPHSATWIAWPHNVDDWPGKFGPIPWVYVEIVRLLSRVERVEILVNGRKEEQQAADKLDRVGVDVDKVCRDVIVEAGWGDAFVHGTGHGVGLDIHEEPRVSATSAATLAVGHVVTVEPGVYLPEHGGVRIEDTLVTREGGPELFTKTTKELLVL